MSHRSKWRSRVQSRSSPGGASGLGLATVRKLARAGARVVILDLPASAGQDVADTLGDGVVFAGGDVTETDQVSAALDAAQRLGDLRILVHCAGKGGPVRVVDREGNPGSLETYERIVRINLIGTFNMLRLSAARMAANDEVDGERGVRRSGSSPSRPACSTLPSSRRRHATALPRRCRTRPRLGNPDEYAGLAAHIVESRMLNGESIRLDGALRMAPR